MTTIADNVAITAGSGTTIATDDVGGVQYQRVKLVDGTLDSSAAIAGDATNGLDVDVTRMPNAATTSTLTNVGASASNVTVLASNANRLGATIFNDSTSIVYVKLGATASATSYTLQMAPGSFYELPVSKNGGVYTGIIDGIWIAANGNARVTEITA